MNENKKPMSKAKKELIAYIINIVTGTLIMIAGIIMTTNKAGLKFGFGIALACIGSMLIGMAIYGTYIAAKKVKQEKLSQ